MSASDRTAPAALVLLLAIGVGLAFACGGQVYIHRRFARHDFIQHNEVGGFIVAVAGTLYAVLLGFLTVIAWSHYADARNLVARESAAATDTWHVATGLPAARRRRVRQDILTYARLMIEAEWPAMRAGGFDRRSDLVVMDAIDATATFAPAGLDQSNAQAATLQQLSTLHDVRQERLTDNAGGITWLEWLVLLVGGACIIAFCWLFGMSNERAHLLMTSIVTIIMASTIVLLFELQYPFRSGISIAPDAWTGVVDHIRFMQSGTQMNMRM